MIYFILFGGIVIGVLLATAAHYLLRSLDDFHKQLEAIRTWAKSVETERDLAAVEFELSRFTRENASWHPRVKAQTAVVKAYLEGLRAGRKITQ